MLFIGISFLNADIVNAGLPEYHHLFPQAFRGDFARLGIDVDDFTIMLSKEAHRGSGGGIQYSPANWNATWKKYLARNPNASETELYAQAQKMLKESGAAGKFDFYNYQTKQVSKAAIAGAPAMAVSSNWFLSLCAKIGSLAMRLLGGYGWGRTLLAFFAGIGTTVLGWFGIKASHPTTVGVGLLCCIIGILLIIFAIWFILLLYKLVLLPIVVALGAIIKTFLES
jgi:hypothetical protein